MTESSKTHVILLSCGSFNPITKGHIHMFGEAAGVGVVERGGGSGSVPMIWRDVGDTLGSNPRIGRY